MTQPLAPRSELRTHTVFNQSEPLSGINLFSADRVLEDAVSRNGGDAHRDRLSAFGARVGSAEVQEWGRQANENPPKFKPFDRYGHRIDEVEFHPAYHQLMALGLEAGCPPPRGIPAPRPTRCIRPCSCLWVTRMPACAARCR